MRFEDLDQGGGYLFRISHQGRSVLSGGGGVCAYPINSASAFTIARDKAHTKSVLAAAGIPHIAGGLFFSHKRRVSMRGPGREIEDAIAFATSLGFPIFCKPNQGGRGNFAEIVESESSLADFAQRVAVEFESFLVEPVIQGVEHRVLVKDGSPLAHITKLPPTLIGDGSSTWGALLDAYNARLEGSGVSASPLSALGAADRFEKPARGERLMLGGRRNFHAAGSVEQVSDRVPSPLADLARAATEAVGLRLGAVDLFDVSAKDDFSDLVVIEVNANPGLASLECDGRMDIIDKLWTDMLTEALET